MAADRWHVTTLLVSGWRALFGLRRYQVLKWSDDRPRVGFAFATDFDGKPRTFRRSADAEACAHVLNFRDEVQRAFEGYDRSILETRSAAERIADLDRSHQGCG